VVNIPIDGWMPLAFVMSLLWLHKAFVMWRADQKPAAAPVVKREARPAPANAELPGRYEDFCAAMKALNFSPAETKAVWQDIDQSGSLDEQVGEACRKMGG
jgi:hypothetical protein